MKSIIGNDNQPDGAVSSDRDFGAELARAAAGDPAAIRRLVVEFEPGLTGFARRRRVPEIDSVVNAALSDAFRNLSTFRGTDRRAFRAYLYRILRCRIIDDQRSSQARSRSMIHFATVGADDLIDQSSSNFDDRVVDRQLVDDILGRLTDEQREVLEMRVLSGLSIRETADRTGRSEVAVKAMQRRALLSLRSLLVAVAVLVVCGAVVAVVVNSRQSITVVENAPAGETPDGFDGRAVPLDVAEADNPLIVEDVEPSDTDPTTTALTTTSTSPASSTSTSTSLTSSTSTSTSLTSSTSTSTSPGSTSPTASTSATTPTPSASTSPTSPATTSPASTSPTAPATTTPTTTTSAVTVTTVVSEPPFPIAPLPSGMTNTPCFVVTDGSPAVGEIAFVTYQLTGPYTMFDKTSVDIVGPGNSSALLPGSANPTKAGDGDRFPFVIGRNMLGDEGFAVASTLAAGEVKTRCRIQQWAFAAPCVVTVDGPPAKGDTAQVKFRVPTLYESLGRQQTFIREWGKRSAMIGAETVPFTQDRRAEFTINGYMFKDGQFEARALFADGAAYATCEIVER